MYLVQLLLPLADEEGRSLADEHARVRHELTERFGGLTAFTRNPAEGLWKPEGRATSRDDVVVVEVMAPELDEAWWRDYRRGLERALRQESVVVRAQEILLL